MSHIALENLALDVIFDFNKEICGMVSCSVSLIETECFLCLLSAKKINFHFVAKKT